MYQLESKTGWLLDPTFGGSVPFWGSLSLGDVGFPEILEVSDPSLHVDCLPDSMSLLMCYSRRRQKTLFFTGEEVGIKLGAPAGGGENDWECTKT